MRRKPQPPIALWNDDKLAVFNKPPDVIVYDLHGGDSFLARVQAHVAPTAQVCHRLDATTSGALMIGLVPEGARLGGMLFEKRLVKKTYLVVCEHLPEKDRFAVEAQLIEEERRALVVQKGGQEAKTEFVVAARGNKGALLVATPHTGRFHQIRAHLRHVGHPVMGDERYGSRRQVCVALHSAQLAFKHPTTGEAVKATAPVHELFVRVATRAGLLQSQVEAAMQSIAQG